MFQTYPVPAPACVQLLTGGYSTTVTSNEELIERIARALRARTWQVSVAESLTCGRILSSLGAGSDASAWLAGGVVAYLPRVKYALLGVDPGPVITSSCAQQMATGVARLLRSQVAIAATGCGGPDPEEDRAPGTVFIATSIGGVVEGRGFEFSGTPDQVLDATTHHALTLLCEAVQG